MDLSQILDSIPEKTREDFEKPKFQLEDAEALHSSLTLDNPLTYCLFLDRRPDLSEEEKDIVFQIIAKLKANEETEHKFYLDKMRDATEYFNEDKDVEVIIE